MTKYLSLKNCRKGKGMKSIKPNTIKEFFRQNLTRHCHLNPQLRLRAAKWYTIWSKGCRNCNRAVADLQPTRRSSFGLLFCAHHRRCCTLQPCLSKQPAILFPVPISRNAPCPTGLSMLSSAAATLANQVSSICWRTTRNWPKPPAPPVKHK